MQTGLIPTHKLKEELSQRWEDWRRLPRLAAPASSHEQRAACEAALAEIYRALYLPAPRVIWCKSPVQVSLAPFALPLLLRCQSLWEQRFILSDLSDSSLWLHLWNTLAEQLSCGPSSISSEEAPEAHSTAAIWKNIDELLERQIETMALDHSHWCRKQLGNDAFDALASEFLNRIRPQTPNLIRPQINAHLWRQKAYSAAPDELLKHLTATEKEAIAQAFWSSHQTHNKVQQRNFMRAPAQALRAGLKSRVGQLSEIWWGALSPVPSEWKLFLHCLLNQLPMSKDVRRGDDRPSNHTLLNAWSTLMRQSLCATFYSDCCFICEARTITLDRAGMMHNGSGPAFSCSDGYQIYSWHGVTVPPEAITDRAYITVRQIDSQINIEVKRAMLEIFGEARYLTESNAQIVHQDQYGTLYRKDIPGVEALVMVKVRNSTPEQDGHFKDYFLRVPPAIDTARAAVAWTFGMQSDNYQPKVET